jgi:hypothetical protein
MNDIYMDVLFMGNRELSALGSGWRVIKVLARILLL